MIRGDCRSIVRIPCPSLAQHVSCPQCLDFSAHTTWSSAVICLREREQSGTTTLPPPSTTIILTAITMTDKTFNVSIVGYGYVLAVARFFFREYPM